GGRSAFRAVPGRPGSRRGAFGRAAPGRGGSGFGRAGGVALRPGAVRAPAAGEDRPLPGAEAGRHGDRRLPAAPGEDRQAGDLSPAGAAADETPGPGGLRAAAMEEVLSGWPGGW